MGPYFVILLKMEAWPYRMKRNFGKAYKIHTLENMALFEIQSKKKMFAHSLYFNLLLEQCQYFGV